MRLCLTSLCLVLLTASSAVAATRFGGVAEVTASPDLAHDDPYEDVFELRSRIALHLSHRFGPHWKVFVAAEARHDLWSGLDTEASFRILPDEIWVDGHKNQWSLRAGNLRHRYSPNALLTPSDVINPVDAVRAFQGDANIRVPVPGMVLAWNGKHLGLELVALPFFVPAPRSVTGRDFSLLRPGLAEAMIDGLFPPGLGALDTLTLNLEQTLKDELQTLDPQVRQNVLPWLGVTDFPDAFVFNGEAGLRARLRVPHLDLALGAWTGYTDDPLVVIDPLLRAAVVDGRPLDLYQLQELATRSPLLEGKYLRQWDGFATLSFDVSDLVVSAEVLLESRSVQYRNNFEATPLPALTWAAALRWTRGSFVADAEVQQRLVLGAGSDLLGGYPSLWTLAAALRWRDGRDRLELAAVAAMQPQSRDAILRPTIAYDITDAWTLEVSATLLLGRRVALGDLRSFLHLVQGASSYYTANDLLSIRLAYGW